MSFSIINSSFWLGFWGLSPYSFGILFHHPLLVPSRIPGLVSVLFWHPVPSSFPGSGQGFRPCLIIISGVWPGFRGLSPQFFEILLHHYFVVPVRVPGMSPYFFGILTRSGLLCPLFWHPVPSSCLGSGWGSGASYSIIIFFGFGQDSGVCVPNNPIPSSFLGSGWGFCPHFFGILLYFFFLFRIRFRGLPPYCPGSG